MPLALVRWAFRAGRFPDKARQFSGDRCIPVWYIYPPGSACDNARITASEPARRSPWRFRSHSPPCVSDASSAALENGNSKRTQPASGAHDRCLPMLYRPGAAGSRCCAHWAPAPDRPSVAGATRSGWSSANSTMAAILSIPRRATREPATGASDHWGNAPII